VILNNSVNSTDAKTSALADGLGCVEGIKDALGIAEARTVVRELEHDFVLLADAGDLEAAVTHSVESVHGIFDDLDKGLEQLVGVGADLGKVGLDEQAQLGLSSGTARLAHLSGTIDEDGKVYRSLLAWSLLSKAEQVVDEIACTAGLIYDLAEEGVLVRSELVIRGKLLGVAHDRIQRMIDIVSGARDQIAERGEFFLLD